jgi:hypothetical protein
MIMAFEDDGIVEKFGWSSPIWLNEIDAWEWKAPSAPNRCLGVEGSVRPKWMVELFAPHGSGGASPSRRQTAVKTTVKLKN